MAGRPGSHATSEELIARVTVLDQFEDPPRHTKRLGIHVHLQLLSPAQMDSREADQPCVTTAIVDSRLRKRCEVRTKYWILLTNIAVPGFRSPHARGSKRIWVGSVAASGCRTRAPMIGSPDQQMTPQTPGHVRLARSGAPLGSRWVGEVENRQ